MLWRSPLLSRRRSRQTIFAIHILASFTENTNSFITAFPYSHVSCISVAMVPFSRLFLTMDLTHGSRLDFGCLYSVRWYKSIAANRRRLCTKVYRMILWQTVLQLKALCYRSSSTSSILISLLTHTSSL